MFTELQALRTMVTQLVNNVQKLVRKVKLFGVFFVGGELPFKSAGIYNELHLLRLQTAENEVIAKTIGIRPIGACVHNGMTYKDKDQWKVDNCTDCTCQVKACNRRRQSQCHCL